MSAQVFIAYREMFEALSDIRDIAEDHIDYNTDAWHRVLHLARKALGEGQ